MGKKLSWRLVPYYLLVVLVPVVHAPFLNAAIFSAPKLLVLRLLTAVLVGMWSWRIYREGKVVLRGGWFGWVLLGMAVVAVMTTVFSGFFWTSVLGIDGRFIGIFTVLNFLLLAWMAFNDFRDVDDVKRVLKVSVVVAVVTAIYGILQYQVWFDDLTRDFFRWAYSPTERAFSSFGHSTHFAAYLAMHVPVGIWALFEGRGRKRVWGWGFCLVLLVWGVLVSGSRGGLIAAVVVGLGMIVYLGWALKGKFWKILAGGVVGLVVVGGVLVGGNVKTFERINHVVEQIRSGDTIDRESWWKSSVAIWRENPLLGSGLSTFADSYNLYRRADYQVPADEQDRIVPQNAHMEFLNILATQGAVGLGMYLVFLGWMAIAGVRFLRKGAKKKKVMVMGLMMGMAAYLLHSLLSFGVVSTLMVFYLFAGLMMAVIGVRREKMVDVDSRIVSGVLLLMVVVGVFFSVRAYCADLLFLKAKNAAYHDQDEIFLKAIEFNPHEYEYYVEFGDELLKKAQISSDVAFSKQKLNQALDAYDVALSINEVHPNVYNHKAVAYKMLADLARNIGDRQLKERYFADAVVNHEKAVELGPFNPVYIYELAQLFYDYEIYDKAIEYYERVLSVREGFRATYQNLAVSYEKVGNLEKALEYGEKAAELYPDVVEFQEYIERIKGEISG